MIALLVMSAAASAMAQLPLQPFAPLVGHCFAGPAPGDKGTDKHCFESVYGGQHVRDRHAITVGGTEVYAGETIYSVKGSQVIFTYVNSLGGLGTGTATRDAADGRFGGTIHATPDGKEQPMAAIWKLTADGYEVISEGKPTAFKRAD